MAPMGSLLNLIVCVVSPMLLLHSQAMLVAYSFNMNTMSVSHHSDIQEETSGGNLCETPQRSGALRKSQKNSSEMFKDFKSQHNLYAYINIKLI